VLALWSLMGCKKGFVEEYVDGMRHVRTRANSQRNGTARVELEVYPGETELLVTAEVPEGFRTHVRSVYDPSEAIVFQAFDWTGTEYSKTNAGYISETVSLNWPVSRDDPELVPGTYVFEFGVVDEAEKYTSQPLFFDALMKPDDDFDEGALAIDLAFYDGLEDDDDLREAVDEAIEIWEELYGSIGIDLDVEQFAFGEGDLQPPAFGDAEVYEELANVTRYRAVNVVIAPSIESYEEIFGIAGDIPGPLVATGRSAVLINASLSAGADGAFSAEEKRLLAETMAHEVGHYLGLFHPVETSWATWDVLDDTDECDSEFECIDRLGTNLMFPFPVCSGFSCTPQADLSDGQVDVAHRYVGVE
jgi:predicted Zn-dependent protease